MSISADPPDPSMLPPDLWSQLADRIVVPPFIALLGPIGFVVPVPGRAVGRPPSAAGAA